MGTAWARHGHGMLCVNPPSLWHENKITDDRVYESFSSKHLKKGRYLIQIKIKKKKYIKYYGESRRGALLLVTFLVTR